MFLLLCLFVYKSEKSALQRSLHEAFKAFKALAVSQQNPRVSVVFETVDKEKERERGREASSIYL